MHVGIVYSSTPMWPKMQWVHEALLRLGHVTERATNLEDVARLDECCDVLIFMHKSPGINLPDLLRLGANHRSVWVQWWFDLLAHHKSNSLAKQSRINIFGGLLRTMDRVFVKERGLIESLRAMGIRAEWLDQGCPSDISEIDRSIPVEWDVLFFGQGGPDYDERISDVQELVSAGFRMAWASQGYSPPTGVTPLPWCHPDRLPQLCSRASAVLSVDYRHDLDGYWSDRLWMALGMGCCVFRRFTPGLPEGPLAVYRDHHELIQKANEFLGPYRGGSDSTPVRPPGAVELGKEARSWCMRNHTIEARLQELLSRSVPTAAAAVA